MNNSAVVAFIAVVALVVGLVIGYTVFHGSTTIIHDQAVGTSATGSTFATAKIAEVVMVPTTASATSSSVLNTDSQDRFILDAGVACSGATASVFGNAPVAAWTWTAGTTSTAAPTALPTAGVSTQAMNVTVATGTSDAYTATSTYTVSAARRWATGTYMTFISNATSSSATECTPFVHYIGQ